LKRGDKRGGFKKGGDGIFKNGKGNIQTKIIFK
jgi:hypothetical protein